MARAAARRQSHFTARRPRSKIRGFGVNNDRMPILVDLPQPPPHHSASARQWWATTVEAYILQEHHLRILQLACEAWDRSQAAREQLAQEGLTIPGRKGVRPHARATAT
jgi:phage terminase small subunit